MPRADVVVARLARKVAPLFGVPWSGNPFDRTWVCDFASLTLAEIGRGAPYPAREEQARLEARPPATDAPGQPWEWEWAGRGVWTPKRGPVPTALPAATLNRFGPDTKAAVVLVGANRLLADATSAVAEVSRYLAAHEVHPVLRLAVWAGLVLEVYRGQPALVVAAVQARAVQRSLTACWGAHVVASDPVLTGSARSELPLPARDDGDSSDGDSSGGDGSARPTQLDLVDRTLPLLDLRVTEPGADSVALVGDRLDDIAGAWCRRLLQLGRPGRGVVWLTQAGGHRSAQAYVRVGAVVAPFVAEVLDGVPLPGPAPVPEPPTPRELAALARSAQRAHIVAAHVAVNYLRYRDDLLQAHAGLRDHTRARLVQSAGLAIDVLGADDPAAVLATGYALYLDLWDRLQRPLPETGDLAEVVDRVQAFQARIIAGHDGSGIGGSGIDPGTATYLLEITNVALAAAAPWLGWPAAVDRSLDRSWRACLGARDLVESQVLAAPGGIHPAQAFHLHHYAAHLAHGGGVARLRRALALQTRVSEVRDDVARREPVGYPAKHTASRTAHELAAAIALALAGALPARERVSRAAAGSQALQHALAVLDNPSTPALLRSGVPVTAVMATARSVLPALAGALGGQDDSAAGRDGLLTPARRACLQALLAASRAVRAAQRPSGLTDGDLARWADQLGLEIPAPDVTASGARRPGRRRAGGSS
jgi:hypothetical protein